MTRLIIIASVTALALIWSGRLEIYTDVAGSEADTLVSTLIQTTGTIGAVALAVAFLTAQLSTAGSRPSVVRELYRSSDVYVLVAYLSITVLGGYLALASSSLARTKTVDSLLVLASSTTLLVLPVIMSQLQNLDRTILAAKLSARLRPRAIVEYGLTEVNISSHDEVQYHLITVGLRPSGVDPLRPMHELLMDAVENRDRVLFGKLFRYLLDPISKVYGARWDPQGTDVLLRPSLIGKLWAKRRPLDEKLHLSLAILHYSVKRARNLLTEWEGRDIGRHGILTGVGDLIRCLTHVDDAGTTVRICLYATWNIAEMYAGVRPYGRIEPMNAYFFAVEELAHAGKLGEARLAVQILGWISVHTEQLHPDRAGDMPDILSQRMRRAYEASRRRAERAPDWIPGRPVEDPWRSWPFPKNRQQELSSWRPQMRMMRRRGTYSR